MVLESMEKGYSGNESYKFVDKLIDGNGDFLIITPYIDAFYAEKVLKAGGRRRIKIITSGAPNNKEALALLAKGKKSWVRFVGIYFLVLAGLLYLAHFYNAALLSAGIFVIVALFIVLRRINGKGKQANVEVKVVKNFFVHEKIYISVDSAIVGSANLTYNGMHKNIEHIEIISDPSRVAELKSHFNRLWGM